MPGTLSISSRWSAALWTLSWSSSGYVEHRKVAEERV